jgi:DNA mismatch endonuclease (patch repair protein)
MVNYSQRKSNIYLCSVADVHSKEIRSKNMAAIKGKNTKPELLVRKFLHANGFRYKLHDKSLPGKPDIVLPKYKTVICEWLLLAWAYSR